MIMPDSDFLTFSTSRAWALDGQVAVQDAHAALAGQEIAPVSASVTRWSIAD